MDPGYNYIRPNNPALPPAYDTLRNSRRDAIGPRFDIGQILNDRIGVNNGEANFNFLMPFLMGSDHEVLFVDAQGLMLKAMEREAGVVTAAPAAVAPLPPEQPVCVPLMPLLQEPPLPAFLRSVEREDGERLESGNVKRWTRIAIAVVLMVVGLAVFEAQSLWLNEAVPVNKSAGSGLQTVPAGR